MECKNVLSYAQKANLTSVVLASTLEVYGTVTDDSCPLTEDMQGYLNPMSARSSYPLAKRAAEALCHNYAKEYGTPVKVARLAQDIRCRSQQKRQPRLCTICPKCYQ